MLHTEEDRLSNAIIGCALEVHQGLGPGLLESAYETCLCYEMTQRGIAFERQKEQPVKYKQVELDAGYRLDLVVGGLVVVELKSVAQLEPIHEAQMLTHLKLSGLKLGLLMNFNVPVLKSGIKRMVNGL
ncbi:MAG: GxxExxY protein [Planctomycetota bacterium]